MHNDYNKTVSQNAGQNTVVKITLFLDTKLYINVFRIRLTPLYGVK